MRKYLAIDLETASDVPERRGAWKKARPFGICCAAACCAETDEVFLWHGKDGNGSPTGRLTKAEVQGLVEALKGFVRRGYTLLTWNGLGFDFDVLAEESDAFDECKELALAHVDMMFHVFCEKGYPVSLAKAAEALKLPGKHENLDGVLIPGMWKAGDYQRVLDYAAQDVKLTCQVAIRSETNRRFQWITSKGTRSAIDLNKGWVTVAEALQKPEPDTSWMDRPLSRREFTNWVLPRNANERGKS